MNKSLLPLKNNMCGIFSKKIKRWKHGLEEFLMMTFSETLCKGKNDV